ncbi:MAG: xylulokinase [Streptosporangiaceae bacterium]
MANSQLSAEADENALADDQVASATVRSLILQGQTILGIELGSTRIKACLIGSDSAPIAAGGAEWENELVAGVWTYSLDAVWSGLRDCVADLLADVERRYQVRPSRFRAVGVSGMMHGYLAFDASGQLLVPFRTWRNTTTGQAAAELTRTLGVNVPLRWSVAHLLQAVLNNEPHVPHIRFLTTLAGYVHWRLTGRQVLGVGDASGMFPIDPATKNYDQRMLRQVDALVAARVPELRVADLLPEVLVAGRDAGRLTQEGAALLDPGGTLRPGALFCPPEGDAGTGMVSTNCVRPRLGSVSVGTSIFAMVILEKPLQQMHPELDLVTTPAGDLVAMVHCNNGASELRAWATVFEQFATALGRPAKPDDVFGTLMREALAGEADGGGLLAYNYLSGEPITGMTEGRPLLVRTPDSRLTLANFARTQVYSAFATLSLGMHVLAQEGVELESLFAQGGLFRTPGVAQRLLAAALGAPVAVGRTADEGGAWGIALLAAYLGTAPTLSLEDFLSTHVFVDASFVVMDPAVRDVEGFAAFLSRYRDGLQIEQVATKAVPGGVQ